MGKRVKGPATSGGTIKPVAVPAQPAAPAALTLSQRLGKELGVIFPTGLTGVLLEMARKIERLEGR